MGARATGSREQPAAAKPHRPEHGNPVRVRPSIRPSKSTRSGRRQGSRAPDQPVAVAGCYPRTTARGLPRRGRRTRARRATARSLAPDGRASPASDDTGRSSCRAVVGSPCPGASRRVGGGHEGGAAPSGRVPPPGPGAPPAPPAGRPRAPRRTGTVRELPPPNERVPARGAGS